MGKVILKCDSCGKESRIRRSYLSDEQFEAVESNIGCFCSKCNRNKNLRGYSITISAGDLYTIYLKVISISHIKAVKRAKEIAERGKAYVEKYDGWD